MDHYAELGVPRGSRNVRRIQTGGKIMTARELAKQVFNNCYIDRSQTEQNDFVWDEDIATNLIESALRREREAADQIIRESLIKLGWTPPGGQIQHDRKVASEAIRLFAHWKDGVEYVGTTGMTLKEAREELLEGKYDPYLRTE